MCATCTYSDWASSTLLTTISGWVTSGVDGTSTKKFWQRQQQLHTNWTWKTPDIWEITRYTYFIFIFYSSPSDEDRDFRAPQRDSPGGEGERGVGAEVRRLGRQAQGQGRLVQAERRIQSRWVGGEDRLGVQRFSTKNWHKSWLKIYWSLYEKKKRTRPILLWVAMPRKSWKPLMYRSTTAPKNISMSIPTARWFAI